MMSEDVLIPIVDENDDIITYKPRGKVLPEEIYRVSSLWVSNDKGEVLVAQRALTKKNDPGCWGPAVAGTVEKDESYDENIIKEMAEEIGVTIEKPRLIRKYRVKTTRNYFCAFYYLKINWSAEQFIINPEEVIQVKWVPYEDLILDVGRYPDKYVPSFPAHLASVKDFNS
jgi:isopentenyl-diphosphate Delta-isomerase